VGKKRSFVGPEGNCKEATFKKNGLGEKKGPKKEIDAKLLSCSEVVREQRRKIVEGGKHRGGKLVPDSISHSGCLGGTAFCGGGGGGGWRNREVREFFGKVLELKRKRFSRRKKKIFFKKQGESTHSVVEGKECPLTRKK